MNTINWLHLSDWHQKGEDFGRTVVLDRLIDDIRQRANIDRSLANWISSSSVVISPSLASRQSLLRHENFCLIPCSKHSD
ncbi:hypothetical protein [Siccirubricoccus sp. G192]|uniref:hypothetical protein n=1 Tax=Siccirubricoccus sp. G192 TaxID=2849651 RepID=UPI001C2C6160|nr:hypothetical protein [Siccirubricoccus sp. G192]MBV1800598.1 hypothetical protein [Siccirubricoccus sp. G192]